MKVSLILPTYNEKGNIVELVKSLLENLKKAKLTPEIIVVDDDSPDATAESVRENFSRNRNVRVFVRKKERGLATAIAYGIKQATGEAVVVMDTDFNHAPELVPELVAKLEKADFVVGSRFVKGGGMAHKKRELLSRIFNMFLVRPIIGSPVRDNLSGFFAIKRNNLEKASFKKIFWGYGDYFIRLIFWAKKKGYKFAEIPSFYKERKYGVSKSNFLHMLYTYTLSSLECRIQSLAKSSRARWFVPLVLLIITLLAYGQTLRMYFWIDDNALIYKLQHFDQNIGLWGEGFFGSGPYRHIVSQFVPFYPLFKTNPMPYFAVGIILYWLAACAVYLFTKVLTGRRLLALSAASIFAAGYVGSETIFGITNSWQTSRGIVMTLFTFLLYYKFLKTGKLFFYVASLVLFFLSLETVYIRAHGLIFALIFFELLFGISRVNARTILTSFTRLLPFLFIHYKIYLTAAGALERFKFWSLPESIFVEKKFFLASIPLQDLGNLFLPDVLTSRVDKFLALLFDLLKGDFSVGSTLAGVAFTTFFVYLFLKNRRDAAVKVLTFTAAFMIANFVMFYAIEPTHTLWTTHRYFSYSFVGLSLFWATAFWLISKRHKTLSSMLLLTVVVVVVYLWLGISYQYSFNTRRSLPAKAFFAAFQKSVPRIPKGAVTYFDLANDTQIRGQFGSFFGGIFSEGSNLAIYSEGIDYMTDFTFTYDFDEILRQLESGETTIDKVFTFYYGGNGLVDTTWQVRALLQEDKSVVLGNFETREELLEIVPPENTPSHVPAQLTFSMRIAPAKVELPYESGELPVRVESDERARIFSYLASQNNFRQKAKATSASFWKEQNPQYAIDGRLDTAWRGHRGFWDEYGRGRGEPEFFRVDLGAVRRIGQIRWISAQRPLVPTHYKILTSLNGVSWSQAKEVIRLDVLPEGTEITDSFEPVNARFIKMEIIKTYGNDGPEIKEFEPVETRFADLDRGLVEQVREAPFAKIDTLAEYNQALAYIKNNATMRFFYMSSADSKQDPNRYVEVPIFVDGRFHEYGVDLPATGLSWTKFTLEGFNFPAEVTVRDAKINYASF